VQKIPDSPFLKIIFHPLSTWDQFLKRVVDIVLSLGALFILAPFLTLVALLIRIDSKGPIFYKQKRSGFRGKDFILYKFRSMISDAEKHTGPVWAEKNDQRITRLGRILRPLRIDELPQLLNVLRGDMSFVGPRPERPAFVEQLREIIPLYTLRLTVHPGITGLAQVQHAYDVSVEHVKRKLEYDLRYINNMSLRLDLKIFLKTVLTVLKKEGAH
jgi:exopolysaccharide biosynthesis polyprenyl glycosylphosphotransferase